MSVTSKFEALIILALKVLLMAIIAIATGWLGFLLVYNTWQGLGQIETALQLQEAMQRAMAGIFVILLGLELLETVRTYAKHHRLRLEIVLVVGAIAVARHIIQLDFHHVDGLFLGGLGILIMALVGGYFALQRIPESLGGSKPEGPGHAD